MRLRLLPPFLGLISSLLLYSLEAEAQDHGMVKHEDLATIGDDDEAHEETPNSANKGDEPASSPESSRPSWSEIHETEDKEPNDEKAKAQTPTPSETETPVAQARSFSTLILIEGSAKYGLLAIAPANELGASDTSTTLLGVGLFGAQATVGIMPGDGAFTLGGRLRTGMYVGQDIANITIGADVLVGTNFSPSLDGRSLSYLLGGVGVEYIPANNRDILVLHAAGGQVKNGFSYGVEMSAGANDTYAVFLLGLRLGWARLF